MVKKYPLFDIFWDQNDIDSISKVIKRGSYWATGPEIREFEKNLSDYFNVKYISVFNSGTSALHAVLLAYGITSGEVLVPSMSFISTANCVILAGAKPIFADIEDITLGLDLEDIKSKITSKTKAIIPMHYGGKVCKNIKVLKEIADDYHLKLIEDNAESFGAKLDDILAGCFGHASMLSFCQNKIISTGEGGAICTNDENIHKKLLLIRSHGRVEQKGVNYFSSIEEMEYIEVGYNFRMPTICAALGISQLKKIEKIIQLRRKIGKFYDKKFTSSPCVEIFEELENHRQVYQLYSVKIKDFDLRNDLQDFLLQNNIFTKVYFYPIHLKSYYRNVLGYKEGDLPKTELISKKILTLPMSLSFKEDDQNYIIDKINEFFSNN